MALNFSPPQDLINAYLNRPSPGQIASEGIQNAIQSYSQSKEQEKKQASLDAQRKAAEFKAIADYVPEDQIPALARNYGINIPSAGAVPPTPSTGTIPSPTAGTPDAQGAPVTQAQSPFVQAHAQSTGFNPLGITIPTSKAGLAKYKENLDIQDKQKKLEAPPKGPEGYYDASGNKKFDLPHGSHLLPAGDLNVGTKESNQQDKLEEIYRKSIQSIRGDPSLKRTEEQRDAAATAYNRIQEVKEHGQVLNPIDYVDILGQIYKARTGSAPTNEVLQQARQATAKGDFGKAFTFVTGEQAPATTEAIQESLQKMALSMGQQADKFHEGYMKSRVRPPLGLAHDRVENVHAERGMSFAEATGQSNSIPTISNDADFKNLPSGTSFKDPSGQVHRKK